MRTTSRIIAALLIFLFSVLPTVGTALLTASAKYQESQLALDSHLVEVSRGVEYQLQSDLKRFQQILLTTAQNPAFIEVMRDPAHREDWKRQIDRNLLSLTKNFPGMIDETCRIDPNGVELGRVVQGFVSPDEDLSPDESRNPFFRPTMALPMGEVYVQPPYISPDTKRWVMSESTPLHADSKNYGILHFEVPLAYYFRTLKSIVPSDGLLALVGPKGQVYLNTQALEPVAESFPDLHTLSNDPQSQAGVRDLLGEPTGFASWKIDDKSYRLRYKSIEPIPGLKLIVLVGLPAGSGFLPQFTPFVAPLSLGALAVLLVTGVMAWALSRPHKAPEWADLLRAMWDKRYRLRWAILTIVIIGSVSAVGSIVVNRSSSRHQQLESIVARIEDRSQTLQNLQIKAERKFDPQFLTQVRDIRQQIEQSLGEFARLDADGLTWQRISAAVDQYEGDVDEWFRLTAAGRSAEALIWAQERVEPSHDRLRDVLTNTDAIYSAVTYRADQAAAVGSSLTMVLAAIVMSLLFWRFEQARIAAELASRAKGAFLANMSHELRTPLTAIIGYSELLQMQGPLLTAEDLVADLKKIQGAGQHLLALISDILDLSKIEAGKMDLNIETFHLRALVEYVIANTRPLIEQHANRLELTYADDLGMMRADLTKVRQILLNLLSNAAKFTEHGVITLVVERETSGHARWISFRVTDTGIGMSVDQQRQLFKEFTQVGTSATRKPGGTGLGLALSRRLCQMMGGEITVVSAPGNGSTFTVRLPTELVDQANAIWAFEEAPGAVNRKA